MTRTRRIAAPAAPSQSIPTTRLDFAILSQALLALVRFAAEIDGATERMFEEILLSRCLEQFALAIQRTN